MPCLNLAKYFYLDKPFEALLFKKDSIAFKKNSITFKNLGKIKV